MFKDNKFKIVAATFIITLLLWLFFSDKFDLWPIRFNNGEIITDTGYLVSLLASFLEDLVFFSLIGFAVYWASNKPSSEEPFKTRVRSLANNKSVHEPEILTSLEENVARALAFCEYVNLEFILEEYIKDKNVLLISAKIDARIVNMCKDVKYKLKSTYFIEPGEAINGSYGVAHCMAIYDEKDMSQKEGFENESREISHKEGIQQKFNFQIDKNGSAITKTSYKIWIKADKDFDDVENWLFFELSRFTNILNLTVTNNTNIEINAVLRALSSDTNQHTPLSEHSLGIGQMKNPTQFKELYRKYRDGDRVELNFYT